MWWQVRAVLEDRPGALAALAMSCGEESVNILGLQVFPCLGGRVVDELVLCTAGGWSGADVERLVRQAGVEDAVVTPCSPHVLEDQPRAPESCSVWRCSLPSRPAKSECPRWEGQCRCARAQPLTCGL